MGSARADIEGKFKLIGGHFHAARHGCGPIVAFLAAHCFGSVLSLRRSTGEGSARAMAWQTCQKTVSLAAFAACLFACVVSQALAGDATYCVTCTNPDQTYLCRVDAGGAKAIDALKLYCIIRTAKEGHHGSCSVDRPAAGCNGVEKLYSYDGPLPEDIAADVKKFNDKVEQQQKIFEKPKSNQPKTLVELGGRAASATRQGWRNARNRFGGASPEINQSLPEEPQSLDHSPAPLAAEPPPALPPAEADQPNRVKRASSAVGGFARKSYRCVVSLFRSCREEPGADELR
jgi:hypothetical protein